MLETKVLSVDSTGNEKEKNQESLQKRRNVTIEDTSENVQITRYSKTDSVKSALKAALLKCDLLKNVPDQTRFVFSPKFTDSKEQFQMKISVIKWLIA